VAQRKDTEVLVLRHEDVKYGWEQWYLLAADVHYDNPTCDRRMFHRHLNEAKDKNAKVMLFGDTLDAMQGRGDPRSSKDETDEEYNADDYMDLLVDRTAHKLNPWLDLFELITLGNHEHAALQHYGTNIARRLAHRLGAQYSGYAGFVRFRFSAKNGRRTSRLLYYHHGGGGGGPVTKGTLNPSRRGLYQPDADIIVAGHIHEQWLFPITRVRVSDGDRVYKDKQYHLQIPTYKDEWSLQGNSFPMRKEQPPKPLGAWWLKFYYHSDKPGNVGMSFELAE
jgi:hypothetical protein